VGFDGGFFDKNPVSGRPPTKETGFLPNLLVSTKYFVKKPGFWPPAN
jgi:hypothetical protein